MTKVRSTDGSMIDDRRGQRGGGGLGGLGGGLPIPIKAGGGLVGILVLLAAVLLPRLLGSGDSGQGFSTSDGSAAADVADGTCNSELEQIVCGATEDVQGFWTEAVPRFWSEYRYTPTKTVFFAGATSTGCGGASSETGPFYCPADQLVYIDLDFMQELEQRLIGATSDLAEQYIVAHEYGHHLQNLLGINTMVQQAEETQPDQVNEYSIAMELQADCFAGVWVSDVARRGLLDSTAEISEALAAAEGVGDDRIQQKTTGRVDPESWNHGSAEQRQSWFQRGFDTGDPTRCNTFDQIVSG